MEWLGGLVRTKSGRKGTKRPPRRASRGSRGSKGKRRGSNGKRRNTCKGSKPKTRYTVTKSDNRVRKVHKRENKPGYAYKKRTDNGVRNIPVKGTTYKTEAQARKRADSNRRR